MRTRSSDPFTDFFKENYGTNPQRLPRLMFVEDHTDPITATILTRLTKRIADLGYHVFYEELPKELTLEKHIDMLNKEENYFKNVDLVKATKEDCFYPAKLALKPFLLSLKENNIQYVGIDEKSYFSIFAEGRDSLKTIGKERDKDIAHAYMKATKPVFGRVAINRLRGIQNEILKTTPLAVAANNFYFINIYSKPENSLKNILNDEERKLKYPLDITLIHSEGKSIDEIAEKVMSKFSSTPQFKNM